MARIATHTFSESKRIQLKFNFLPPRDIPSIDHETIWGRFPPELRYNMDQVPLSFVNGQDTTFTTADTVFEFELSVATAVIE
mgnify:CR=1 FL=1